MGVSWESVVVSELGFDAGQAAACLSGLLPACVVPARAMAHMMYAGDVVSVEMTAFGKRPLPLRPDAGEDLAQLILGSGSFETPIVLAARELSRLFLGRALYLYASDGYDAAAYVVFEGGEVREFQVLNWGGESMFNASPPVEDRPDAVGVFASGCGTILGLNLAFAENAIEHFYGMYAKVSSFTLAEDGGVLQPPRREA